MAEIPPVGPTGFKDTPSTFSLGSHFKEATQSRTWQFPQILSNSIFKSVLRRNISASGYPAISSVTHSLLSCYENSDQLDICLSTFQKQDYLPKWPLLFSWWTWSVWFILPATLNTWGQHGVLLWRSFQTLAMHVCAHKQGWRETYWN